MKIIKKTLKVILVLLIIYIIIQLFPIISFHKEINMNALSSFYKKGVYHIHSTFSDGMGDMNEISAAASKANLHFVILNDHGRPNVAASKSTCWMNNVLIIGGSELSLNSGHLTAMGYQLPEYMFPPEPQDAINEVNHYNGVCFLAHPFDEKIPWTNWEIKNFTGIEILNAASFVYKMKFYHIPSFLIQSLFNSKYSILNSLEYPKKNLFQWDSFNTKQKTFGIYALDAHAKLELSERIQFNFPSYKTMFEIFTLYVKVDGEINRDSFQSASTIISSIKRGNFFNVVEALSSAHGFENYFIQTDGKRIEMGSSSTMTQGILTVEVPFNFYTDIIIKKNGKLFNQIFNNHKFKLEFDIHTPGVYRTEIYISKNKFNKIPWILANPFFIGMNYSEVNMEKNSLKKLLIRSKETFSLETSENSEGTITYKRNIKNELITHLKYNLQKDPDKKDYWIALSIRDAFDFSTYNGFVFETRSNKRKRFWIEFRTGKDDSGSWYRHSFPVISEWREIHIPFEKFQMFSGKESFPDLTNIQSLFFSINNAITYPGTQGYIQLKKIGLY